MQTPRTGTHCCSCSHAQPRTSSPPAGSGATIGARAAVLMKLLHGIAGAVKQRLPGSVDSMLQTAAAAMGRLTPEMLMALMTEARQGSPDERAVVHDVVGRMDDTTIAG